MKKIFLLAAMLLLMGAASAQTTQPWVAGWDNFSEPLDLTHSKIVWSISPTAR